MASQPANTTIAVRRRIRSFRDMPFNRTTFETFQRINPQNMMTPSEEHLDYISTRNANTDDGLILNTSIQANEGDPAAGNNFENLSGLPIVRYANTANTPTLAAATAISGIGFVVRIGQDAFIEKTTANAADDLHQNLRDI